MLHKPFFLLLLFQLFCASYTHAQINSQAASPLLKTGDTLPALTLQTMEGEPYDLLEKLKDQPVILIFYRAHWCPYCNEHLSDLQAYEKQYAKLGYAIIAISTESPAGLEQTRTKTNVRYLLLSDEEHAAVKAFGVENGPVAVPSVFIADRSHVIRFVHSDPDYKTRLSGAEVLSAAKSALKQ